MNGDKETVLQRTLKEILEQEFLIKEDWNTEKLEKAGQILEEYDNVEEFLTETGWGRDNPEYMSEEYLTKNRICRWSEGKFLYFSRILWETQEGCV